MKSKLGKLALLAAFGLALAFTFNCSSGGGGDDEGGGGLLGHRSSSSSGGGGRDGKLVCAAGEAWLENNGRGEQGFVFKSNGDVIQLEQCANGWCIEAEYKWKTKDNHLIWYMEEGGEEEDEGTYSVSGNTLEIRGHTYTKTSGIYPVPKSSGGGTPSSNSKPSSSSVVKSSSSLVVASSSSSMFSSSSVVLSSSSIGVGGSSSSSSYLIPSSSSISIQYGISVVYDGVTYPTVIIGTQTWMARNLYYNVSGSKCGEGGVQTLSDGDTWTCDTYGRLYNWSTAMALDANCNSTTCASRIGTPHRGICPPGWHIPSNAEWQKLVDAVGGYEVAGRYLKSKEGWKNNSNGLNSYGFSALPSGVGSTNGNFLDAGYFARWWSSTEYDANNAYERYVRYEGEYSNYASNDKTDLYSVRCLKDSSTAVVVVPSSSSTTVSVSCDFAYRTVTIGNQTWMAENLNCDVPGSVCYDYSGANCYKYGRLYNWETAKSVCPSGWRLPSDADWTTLAENVGGALTAGTKLKASSGWNSCGLQEVGTDYYLFSAMPGGYGDSSGNFYYAGNNGYWWTATASDASNARHQYMGYCYTNVLTYSENKTNLYSVRCIKN